jgi:hypothetical protein
VHRYGTVGDPRSSMKKFVKQLRQFSFLARMAWTIVLSVLGLLVSANAAPFKDLITNLPGLDKMPSFR